VEWSTRPEPYSAPLRRWEMTVRSTRDAPTSVSTPSTRGGPVVELADAGDRRSVPSPAIGRMDYLRRIPRQRRVRLYAAWLPLLELCDRSVRALVPVARRNGSVLVGSSDARLYASSPRAPLHGATRPGSRLRLPGGGGDSQSFAGSLDARLYSLTSAGSLSGAMHRWRDLVLHGAGFGREYLLRSRDRRLYALTTGGIRRGATRRRGRSFPLPPLR
jgi:hypothetical protein